MKNSDSGWHQTECLPVLSDSWSLLARGDLNQISLVIWPVFIATVHQSVQLALQGLASILHDDERADVGVRWIIVLNQYDRIKLIIPLWQQHAGKPGPLQVYELPSANNILSPEVCVCVWPRDKNFTWRECDFHKSRECALSTVENICFWPSTPRRGILNIWKLQLRWWVAKTKDMFHNKMTCIFSNDVTALCAVYVIIIRCDQTENLKAKFK